MKVVFDIIAGNKLTNDFMHAADTFEKGKQLGEHKVISFTITSPCNFLDLPNIVKQGVEASKENVIFVGFRELDGKRVDNVQHYFMPNVQSVSNGRQFCTFKSMLQKLGYEVETDERMHVINVT